MAAPKAEKTVEKMDALKVETMDPLMVWQKVDEKVALTVDQKESLKVGQMVAEMGLTTADAMVAMLVAMTA